MASGFSRFRLLLVFITLLASSCFAQKTVAYTNSMGFPLASDGSMVVTATPQGSTYQNSKGLLIDTVTGALYIGFNGDPITASSLVTGKVNNIIMADQANGGVGSFSTRMTAALTTCASAACVIDARGFNTAQTCDAEVDITFAGVVIFLPPVPITLGAQSRFASPPRTFPIAPAKWQS